MLNIDVFIVFCVYYSIIIIFLLFEHVRLVLNLI